MNVFTENIEQVILDNFEKSKKSIVIVMAWFTNQKIIDKLIELKKCNSKMTIEILVDENEVNRTYFFNKNHNKILEAGIDIKRQYYAKFNHNKFSIIDGCTIITGSYNYSVKANTNLENIIVSKDKRIAKYYTRIFKFYTDKTYIDENVELLFEDLDFANKLISTFYPFSKTLFSKVKTKIKLGYCFSHENGMYNEISYEAGLIFNKKYKLHKQLNEIIKRRESNESSLDLITSDLNQEFPLPITKDLILNYRTTSINSLIFSSHKEISILYKKGIDYEELTRDIVDNEVSLKKYYTRKFEKSFNKRELKGVLLNDIDLVIEDYIWINNFAPFLNDGIVEKIYDFI